jgi:hypothetical protein
MAEIIRTRHLPRQKYVEESHLEADLQRSRVKQNLQDRNLDPQRQKVDDSSQQQEMQPGGIESNSIQESQDTAEELETMEDFFSGVGIINVN